MKNSGGWHKGRLSKGSNADQIMEQVKKGGTVLAEDVSASKAAEVAHPASALHGDCCRVLSEPCVLVSREDRLRVDARGQTTLTLLLSFSFQC